MPRKLAWYAYCGLVLLLGYGRMLERILLESGGPWSRYGPPLAATIVCAGIVAWLRDMPLAFNWFWRITHLLLIAALLALGVYGGILLSIRTTTGAVFLLVTAVALLPAGVALYRYAWRSPATWENPAG